MKYHTVGTISNSNTMDNQNRRKRLNRYPYHTNTWPPTFLSWYRHRNKLALWTQSSRLGEMKPSCGHEILQSNTPSVTLLVYITHSLSTLQEQCEFGAVMVVIVW